MRTILLVACFVAFVPWTTEPLHGQPADAETRTASFDPEELAGYLPETVAGWERASSEATYQRGDRYAVVRGLYTSDDATLQVVIRDLEDRPPQIEAGPGAQAPDSWADYLAAARQEVEQGEAREVQYDTVLGFEGTGVSDDVVFPHGVMALPGRRFQVNVYEMREGLSSVADIRALSENELNTMLGRARTFVQALDLDGLASRATEAERPQNAGADASDAATPTTVLRSLLPETLAGAERGEIQAHPRRPMIRTRYETSGDAPRTEVQLGYGLDVQQEVRRQIEANQDEMATITHDGRELLLREESSALSLVAFPGDAVLMIAEDGADDGSWDASGARERLLHAFDALDVDRLAAYRAPEASGPSLDAPAGFEGYAADWPSGRITVAYPEAWTLTDIEARTGWIQALSLTSSAEAADVLYGEGVRFSTEDTVRLGTPDNVMVNVGLMGVESSGTSPMQMLDMMPGSVVANAEVTRAPEAVTLDDGTEAAMREVYGTDADGRAIIGQQWALASGGQLVSVSAFMPPGSAEELASTLRTILQSIVVRAR